MTHALVIVCGSALGVMFFGFTVSGSVHATATAKAKTFVGSDVAAIVPPNPPPLRGVGIPATQVVIADAFFSGTSRGVTLLGIDPETFADAAFWDEAFADQDLDALVAAVDASDSGDVPVVASGLAGVGVVELEGVDVRLEIVGRAESFPGTRARQPLLAMTKDSLTRVVRAGGSYITTHQVWAKGTPEAVTTALRGAEVTFYQLLTTDEVLDTPILQSLLWSLGLLGAVGALASGAALVGLSLYLQARHTAAQVATALTRRMAFPRAQELLSSVAEIGGAGAASFLVGAGTGIVTAALVNEQLDIQPALSPDPVLVLPAAIVAVAGVAVVAVAIGTAWRLQRRMDRTSVGEVMRV
ncbi:MAG: hypothetical protein M3273_09510, partial [Actinomycetota bacterium]|nr:hypothetical protein [Actinomycetota bacterium]